MTKNSFAVEVTFNAYLHSDVRVLTNYCQGIRINYHKLFE